MNGIVLIGKSNQEPWSWHRRMKIIKQSVRKASIYVSIGIHSKTFAKGMRMEGITCVYDEWDSLADSLSEFRYESTIFLFHEIEWVRKHYPTFFRYRFRGNINDNCASLMTECQEKCVAESSRIFFSSVSIAFSFIDFEKKSISVACEIMQWSCLFFGLPSW